MDGVAPHLPHTHPAGEVLYIHSASDAAIAFSRGATPCAKSIPKQAGPTEAHPATRPPTRIRRPRAATHAHMCAHPSRPKRDRKRPSRPIGGAKLRKPAGISPLTRGSPSWHGGRASFRAHRNPRKRGHGGRASPRPRYRDSPSHPPTRGRVAECPSRGGAQLEQARECTQARPATRAPQPATTARRGRSGRRGGGARRCSKRRTPN